MHLGLVDIAKEFNVTPQVVNAGKMKDQVPYKYVKVMRKKISKMSMVSKNDTSNLYDSDDDVSNAEIVFDFLKQIVSYKYLVLTISIFTMILFCAHNKFIAEDVYSSESKMIPFRSGENSGFGNLAGQLGLNLGTGGNVGELSLHSSYANS